MKILFDTSVLVAGIVEAHPMHNRALPWLQRGKAGEFDFMVTTHSLAELYAVLTKLPVKPRISPATAWRLVHENVETSARLVPLSPSDYRYIVKRMAEFGLTGGIIYDALIARAAQKSGVERLLTFDGDDFTRIWPEGKSVVFVP
jgi:predicted nucleic acid-binding protein